MNHPTKISYLDIGYIGSLPIRVPITKIGAGDPHLAIVCGIHGDENAGLVISRHFVRELLQSNSLRGLVSIITAANPFAQATGTRVAVSDYFDLNRTGRGKSDGGLTERLAHILCEFLAQCSYVVDLHEFSMMTPTMAIYIPGKQDEVDRRILQGISAFNPSLVWTMNLTTSDEAKYSESLLASLIEHGVPGFAVETSPLAELTGENIRQAAEGLIEVTRMLGITEGHHRTSVPQTFMRRVMRSSFAGIWVPEAALLSHVEEGDKVGEITALGLDVDVPVFSHVQGTLIQLASTNLVSTGTCLFTVGVQDTGLTAKFHALV